MDEDTINFYELLKNELNKKVDNDEKVNNDEKVCLISKEPLEDIYIKLKCGHVLIIALSITKS